MHLIIIYLILLASNFFTQHKLLTRGIKKHQLGCFESIVKQFQSFKELMALVS